MEDILHKWSMHYLFFIGMNGIQTKISDYIIITCCRYGKHFISIWY